MRPIYLDYAATTPPDEQVIQAMVDCMREVSCNPSAAYAAAGAARRIHRLLRTALSRILGFPAENICFTSGGTEANNWVIQAFRGQHVVLSAIEHHSLLLPAQALCHVTLVQPDASGYVSSSAIEAALRPDTKLICLQAANNETGVIQPVEEVYAIAQARHIHLHTDAVQAFGHMPLPVHCCDSMSLSAHKLYGPRGVGALCMREPLSPMLLGGAQEGGLRAGTENTPAICGFHQAASLAMADIADRA